MFHLSKSFRKRLCFQCNVLRSYDLFGPKTQFRSNILNLKLTEKGRSITGRLSRPFLTLLFTSSLTTKSNFVVEWRLSHNNSWFHSDREGLRQWEGRVHEKNDESCYLLTTTLHERSSTPELHVVSSYQLTDVHRLTSYKSGT